MIRFFHNKFLTLKEAQLTRWLENIADAEDYKIDKIDYNFIDAEELLKLNKKHLDHDTDTDIITFDYSEGNNVLVEAYIRTHIICLKVLKMNLLDSWLMLYCIVSVTMTRQIKIRS